MPLKTAMKTITTKDFDRLLADIIDNDLLFHLLSIPGFYQILSEHYNNDVLAAWETEQQTEDKVDYKQPGQEQVSTTSANG